MSVRWKGWARVYLRQALRHRRWQAAVLLGVSTLIAACAAFGPWFARAVEQSITTTTLTEQRNAAAWVLQAAPQRNYRYLGEPGSNEPPPFETLPPEDLDQNRPPDVAELFEPPVYGMYAKASWYRPTQKKYGIGTQLAWRDRFCEHLAITKGRCATAANEVVVSSSDARNYRVGPGSSVFTTSTDQPAPIPLRVTGVYELADPADGFWYETSPVGRSFVEENGGSGDLLLTPRATFERTKWGHYSTVETAPVPGRVGVDELGLLLTRVDELRIVLGRLGSGVTVNTRLGQVDGQITAGRQQATRIIPLVMVQVAVFGIVVLALAAATVVDQRRPELAVARLRGRSTRGAGRDLVAEMSALVALGSVAGIGIAFAVITAIRRTWLAGTAPAELPWTVPAVVGVALLAGVLAIVLAIRPVVRQPISVLLRNVPPRRRNRAIGPLPMMLMSFAAAGLVLGLTGDGRGPLAVVTPALLALAVSLVAAAILTAVAGSFGARALRRGRLVTGLAALELARRRGIGRIVPVVAIAAALVLFAGQASAVAGRNRELRSGLETGAVTVLQTRSVELAKVRSLLDRVDPDRAWSTPVSVTTLGAPDTLRTMAVEPDSFRRVATGGDRVTDDATFDKLRAPEVAPLTIRGGRLLIDAGPIRGGNLRAAAPILGVTYVTAGGSRINLTLGQLSTTRAVRLSTSVACRQGCRLVRWSLTRDQGSDEPMIGTVDLRAVRGDGDRGPVPLGAPGDWAGVGGTLIEGESVRAQPGANGPGLRIGFSGLGSELILQHHWVPVALPVVVTPGFAVSTGTTTPGLDTLAIPVGQVGPVTGTVPRNLYGTALTDLTTLLRWGSVAYTTSTSVQVWLNEEGTRRLADLERVFAEAGVSTSVVDRLSDREDRYARSASALALRLTPIVGLAAWTLALVVLLLMSISTRRGRSHDHASLQLAGVRSSVLTKAAGYEQAGVVAASVLLGAAAGVVGARLALPMIPLFEKPEPAVPIDLGISWPAALLGFGLSAVVLLAGALLLVVSLRRRTSYTRLREEVG